MPVYLYSGLEDGEVNMQLLFRDRGGPAGNAETGRDRGGLAYGAGHPGGYGMAHRHQRQDAPALQAHVLREAVGQGD